MNRDAKTCEMASFPRVTRRHWMQPLAAQEKKSAAATLPVDPVQKNCLTTLTHLFLVPSSSCFPGVIRLKINIGNRSFPKIINHARCCAPWTRELCVNGRMWNHPFLHEGEESTARKSRLKFHSSIKLYRGHRLIDLSSNELKTIHETLFQTFFSKREYTEWGIHYFTRVLNYYSPRFERKSNKVPDINEYRRT